MKKENKILNILLPIASVLLIFLIWFISAISINNSLILPNVDEVLSQFFALIKSGEFYSALLSTLLRSVIGFIISFILAVIFAILSKRSKYFEKFISPVIRIIRALPTVAVVLLLIFWTSSKIAPAIVTTLVVLPTLYLNVLNALNSIDDKQLLMCKIYNVPYKKVLFKVEIPQILPPVLSAIGAGLSLNIKLMVAAEVIAQTPVCLGYMMQNAKVNFEIALMLALVVFAVIIGLIIESVFSLLSKKAGKNL